MRYHSDSQYAHIDMTRAEFDALKEELQPEPLPDILHLGSVGRYWHTPIFVDHCPDDARLIGSLISPMPRRLFDSYRRLDDEVIDAEIVE